MLSSTNSGVSYSKAEENARMALQHDQEKCMNCKGFRFVLVFATVLWGGLPAAILGLVGGWLLMHKTLAPVQALTQAAQKIDALS